MRSRLSSKRTAGERHSLEALLWVVTRTRSMAVQWQELVEVTWGPVSFMLGGMVWRGLMSC
jgi:hypothetical protein